MTLPPGGIAVPSPDDRPSDEGINTFRWAIGKRLEYRLAPGQTQWFLLEAGHSVAGWGDLWPSFEGDITKSVDAEPVPGVRFVVEIRDQFAGAFLDTLTIDLLALPLQPLTGSDGSWQTRTFVGDPFKIGVETRVLGLTRTYGPTARGLPRRVPPTVVVSLPGSNRNNASPLRRLHVCPPSMFTLGHDSSPWQGGVVVAGGAVASLRFGAPAGVSVSCRSAVVVGSSVAWGVTCPGGPELPRAPAEGTYRSGEPAGSGVSSVAVAGNNCPAPGPGIIVGTATLPRTTSDGGSWHDEG